MYMHAQQTQSNVFTVKERFAAGYSSCGEDSVRVNVITSLLLVPIVLTGDEYSLQPGEERWVACISLFDGQENE